MLACVYSVLFVVVPWLILLHLHAGIWGFGWLHALLVLFCSINTMISVWEVSLHVNAGWIKSEHSRVKAELGPQKVPPIFMFQHVSLRDAFSLQYWANVWYLYSFFDSSYAEPKSYGFWIDSGNGVSTLIPTILFALGVTFDIMDPRHLGMLGLLQFYQEFYGTVLYFWSFVYNRRWTEGQWQGRTLAYIWTLVIVSNGIWMVFPALGMYASYHMVMTGEMDIVRGSIMAGRMGMSQGEL